MTQIKLKIKKNGKELLGIVFIISILVMAVALPKDIAQFVKDGLTLAVKNVVPTAFPFMIISEYCIFYCSFKSTGVCAKIFRRIYGASPNALYAYVIGNVCGFPLGAKILSEEYERGRIEKMECERLIAYCENPSIAFVVGALGTGMLGSIRRGVMLLFAIHLSSVLCGLIYRDKPSILLNHCDNTRQKPNFVDTVKSSGHSCIDIAAFIATFSVICGIIKKLLGEGLISGAVISILEVTNALNYFTSVSAIPSEISLFFIGFSLGFGGVCVLMQAAIFTSRCGLSLRPYLKTKISQGLITGIILILLDRIRVF